MMAEADDPAMESFDPMVPKHARKGKFFCFLNVNKYLLKDTFWPQQHHKNVLARHRQRSWHVAGVIL